MNPFYVDLPEVVFLQVQGVAWNTPLFPSLSAGSSVWSRTPPSLRSAGLRSRRGSELVSAHSVPFPLSSCARPSLPPLCAPVPPLSFPCPRLPYVSSLHYPLLVLLGLGRDVGTLPQTLAGHAGAIVFAAFSSRGLARLHGPAFATGVDRQKSQSFRCHGVSRWSRLLIFHPFPPLNIDWSARWTVLTMFVFDSLY